jgi:hypothetical protein
LYFKISAAEILLETSTTTPAELALTEPNELAYTGSGAPSYLAGIAMLLLGAGLISFSMLRRRSA